MEFHCMKKQLIHCNTFKKNVLHCLTYHNTEMHFSPFSGESRQRWGFSVRRYVGRARRRREMQSLGHQRPAHSSARDGRRSHADSRSRRPVRSPRPRQIRHEDRPHRRRHSGPNRLHAQKGRTSRSPSLDVAVAVAKRNRKSLQNPSFTRISFNILIRETSVKRFPFLRRFSWTAIFRRFEKILNYVGNKKMFLSSLFHSKP